MRKKVCKILPVLLVCMLVLSSCGKDNAAHAPSAVDKALDDAFKAGRLVLSETEIAKPDPDKCVISVPERGSGYAGEQAVRDALRSGEPVVLSYSPDGKKALAYLETGRGNEILPLIISGDRVTLIRPASGRGAEDPDGLTSGYYNTFFCSLKKCPLGIGGEGVTWSGDERYFYPGNWNTVMKEFRSVHFIVDTQTGELMPLDAFASNPNDERFGMICSGGFSEDSRYFYASYIGKRSGGIIRYDLSAFRPEPVAGTGQNFSYARPFPAALGNGDILVLGDNRPGESQKLVRHSADGKEKTMSLPYDSRTWYGRQLEYSPESGWAVLWGYSALYDEYVSWNTAGSGMQIFRPGEENADWLETALIIDNESGDLKETELSSLFEFEDGGAVKPKRFSSAPYIFLDMELSPDGRYAAVLAGARGSSQAALLIVRLEDKTCLKAEGILLNGDPETGPRMRYSRGLPILNWTEAGLLVNDGSSRLWRIGE